MKHGDDIGRGKLAVQIGIAGTGTEQFADEVFGVLPIRAQVAGQVESQRMGDPMPKHLRKGVDVAPVHLAAVIHVPQRPTLAGFVLDQSESLISAHQQIQVAVVIDILYAQPIGWCVTLGQVVIPKESSGRKHVHHRICQSTIRLTGQNRYAPARRTVVAD